MNHIYRSRYIQCVAAAALLSTGCEPDWEIEDDAHDATSAQLADGAAGPADPTRGAAAESRPTPSFPTWTCDTTNQVSVPTAKLRQALGPPFDTVQFATDLYPSRDGYVLLVTSASSSSKERATVHVAPNGELVATRLPAFTADLPGSGSLSSELLGLVARTAPADQLVRLIEGRTTSNPFIAARAYGPGPTIGRAEPLFDLGYPQRLARVAAGTSLDASRTVVTAGNILEGSFEVAVLGANGTPMGKAQDIVTGGSRIACLQIIPTEHAAAISYVARTEGAGDVWRVIELDSDANIVLESAHPATDCPTAIGSSRTHFVARFATTPEASLVRVPRGQRTPVATSAPLWPPGWASDPVLGIVPDPTGTMLIGRSWNSGELVISRLNTTQSLQGVRAPTIPYGRTTLLPSARGDFTLSVANEQSLELFTVGCSASN